MQTLNAVIKASTTMRYPSGRCSHDLQETLRIYAVFSVLHREADCDEVIPLAEPIMTADGQAIDHIPVQKGQLIECAIHGHNQCVQRSED